MALLEINGLTKFFGGLSAVADVSFDIKKGEILGLIGPNGAGKTTMFNLITGFIRPTKGVVIFKGEDITGFKPDKVTLKGVARTFQLATFFGDMTVLENVIVALHLKTKKLLPIYRQLIKTRHTKALEKETVENAMNILEWLELTSFSNEMAKNLPHGFQRLLSIAIVVAANPELILLDEVVSGMNAEEIKKTMQILTQIHSEGKTFILIEHNMRVAMNFCERFIVLNYGKNIAEGSPEEISNNEQVINAYLGSKKKYPKRQ